VRLDERCKVIEVLLCDADVYSTYEALRSVTNLIGLRYRLGLAAQRAIDAVLSDTPVGQMTKYRTTRITAAYRLIESSPTLRREWFGSR